MESPVNNTIEKLVNKGVKISNPKSLEIDSDLKVDNVSGSVTV